LVKFFYPVWFIFVIEGAPLGLENSTVRARMPGERREFV